MRSRDEEENGGGEQTESASPMAIVERKGAKTKTRVVCARGVVGLVGLPTLPHVVLDEPLAKSSLDHIARSGQRRCCPTIERERRQT